jgi:ParB family chromosome partitioning protein
VKLDQKVTGICPTDGVAGLSSKIIAVDSISVPPERMRKPRPEVVDELAASIATEGLLQPIVVRPDPKRAGFLLVAGWHRLEAKRKLKHETIECRVLDGLSADQARVAEIDENLIRADLTPSERAAHHAERKALYLKLHPETQQGGSREGAGRPKRDGTKAKSKGQNGPSKKDAYTKDAAKKTGKSSRTIKREVARGENIDPQALADLAGTCLDNGTELDALAKLPAAEQRSLAEAAKRGEKVSAITAHSACDSEDDHKTSDGTEELELGKVIARLRRDQSRNADTMRVCDALERRLKRP